MRRSVWLVVPLLGAALFCLPGAPASAGRKTPEEREALRDLRALPRQVRDDAKQVRADTLAKIRLAAVSARKGTLDPGDAVVEVSDAAAAASVELSVARSKARFEAQRIALSLAQAAGGRLSEFARPGACGAYDHALEAIELTADRIERRVQRGVKKAGSQLRRQGVTFTRLVEPLDWTELGAEPAFQGETRLSEVLATSEGDVLVRFGFNATRIVTDPEDPNFMMQDPSIPLTEVFCIVLEDSEGNLSFRSTAGSQFVAGEGRETSVRFSGIPSGAASAYMFRCGQGSPEDVEERLRGRLIREGLDLLYLATDRESLYVPEAEREEPGPGPVSCTPGGRATIDGGATLEYPVVEIADITFDGAGLLVDAYILCKASNDPGAGLFQVLITPETGLAADGNNRIVIEDLFAAGAEVKHDPTAGDSIDADISIDGSLTIEFPQHPTTLSPGQLSLCVHVHFEGTADNRAADETKPMIGDFGTEEVRVIVP